MQLEKLSGTKKNPEQSKQSPSPLLSQGKGWGASGTEHPVPLLGWEQLAAPAWKRGKASEGHLPHHHQPAGTPQGWDAPVASALEAGLTPAPLPA